MKADHSILWVAANFDDPGDGVGKYAARMVEAVRCGLPRCRIEVATARTTDLGRYRRMASGRMAGCLLAVARRTTKGGLRAVVVEYPFLEQSPAILAAMKALRWACSKTGTELVLSLHEYRRVSRLRQWSIRYLAGMADKILATDETTASLLTQWAQARVWIREIPSNLPMAMERSRRDPKGFCYFGVVNRSKAVPEMLRGWCASWKQGMSLHILTTSRFDAHGPSVILHQGLSDADAAQVLAKNSFQVLPIIPSVETNSGSLKAGVLNGLIPIGLPGVTVDKLAPAFISINGYTPECFARAFQMATAMPSAEREARRIKLAANADCYTIQHCAAKVLNALIS